MLFAKLLLSPVPRGRVTRLDASRALAMDGVLGIITEDAFPPAEGQEPVLTNEPIYQGPADRGRGGRRRNAGGGCGRGD